MDDVAVVRLVIQKWSASDLAGVLKLLSDDIVHTVHVGELDVPYMASANGKEELRQRLQMILDTFFVNAFVIDSLVHERDEIRMSVRGYHEHKRTGERLDVSVRFHFRVRKGAIMKIDEYVDTAYFAAFERFVRYLEETAQKMAAGGGAQTRK
jgi:ketosteroid isomerase-like protein